MPELSPCAGMRLPNLWRLLARGALLVVVAGFSGCDSQSGFVGQAFDDSWTHRGFAVWASPPWIEAGFDPESAKLWRDNGFTVQEAASWRQVSNKPAVARAWMSDGFATPEDVKPWLQAFSLSSFRGMPSERSDEASRLRNAGMTAAELEGFTRAGFDSDDPSTMLKVKALIPEAGSIEAAVKYSKEGVQVGGVAAHEHADQLRAARFREATKPCKSIDSEVTLIMASPYAVTGKCFGLSPLQVVQWLDSETVLATAPYMSRYMTTPFYIEAKDLSQSFVPSSLVIAEQPISYETVSGAHQTAFHMRVLAWKSDLDK